jgi:hypothetical protein
VDDVEQLMNEHFDELTKRRGDLSTLKEQDVELAAREEDIDEQLTVELAKIDKYERMYKKVAELLQVGES